MTVLEVTARHERLVGGRLVAHRGHWNPTSNDRSASNCSSSRLFVLDSGGAVRESFTRQRWEPADVVGALKALVSGGFGS